jgi:hypothetical protein
MRAAFIGTLLVSSTLFGATQAAAASYCSTSGSFGACASAGLGLGQGASGPVVGLRNLTGVVGDAGYVLAGFALYYVGTQLSFGSGEETALGALASGNGSPSVSRSGTMGRGSRLAPLRSANSLGRNPRALGRAANGNGPINYTLSVQGDNASTPATTELTTQVQTSTNPFHPGNSGCVGAANCHPPINTTAPEPATMALMAVGLVGLAGAGYVQRRRRS